MLDSFLNKFTGSDYDMRPALTQIHRDGDNLVATDGNSIVICPKSYCEEEYEPVEKFPNYKSVIPKPTIKLSFKYQDFLDLYVDIPTYNHYQKCYECKGDKRVKCQYDHWHECPECNATGITNTIIDDAPLPEKDVIDILGAHFDFLSIRPLANLAKHLGEERVTILHISESKHAALFQVKDIQFFITSIRDNRDENDEESKPEVHKIEII